MGLCNRDLSLFYWFECHYPQPGCKSNKQAISPPRAQDTPSSPQAKRTTCLEDWKNHKSSTIPKIYYPRTNSTHSGSSTTPQQSGPLNPAPETSLSDAPFTPPARYKKTRCSSSEAATPPMNATTTPTTSNYVRFLLFSRLPVVPTPQSKISRTPQKRHE